MKTLIEKSWGIEYDAVLTEQVYKCLASSPEECVCENCKNFLLARKNVYPENFKRMLEQLGIDYKKEIEICYFQRIRPGWHLYKGWFHFVGHIRNMPSDEGTRIYKLVPDFKDFAWSFTNKQDLVPEAFGQSPVVQLEWIGIVPWVIDLPEEN